MAKLVFYNAKTYGKVKDISGDLVHVEFTESQNGKLEGTIKVKTTSGNKSLLNSTKENSHFIVVSTDGKSEAAGIIEDSWVSTEDNKGIFAIRFIGFYDFLAKIPQIYSEKAGQYGGNTTIAKEDESGTVSFFADSTEGLFYRLLINLEETMFAFGYSRFWDYGNIASKIGSNTGQKWRRSYRLNSLEMPDLQGIVSDLIEDDNLLLLKVTHATAGNKFKWVLNFNSANGTKTLNQNVDKIFGIEFEQSDDVKRTFGFASGTDFKERNLVSVKSFDSSVAYSGYVVDTPYEQTKNLGNINNGAINKEKENLGQLTIQSFSSNTCSINDIVTISSDELSTVKFVVTTKSLSGKVYSFTGNIVSGSGIKKGKSRANPATRTVFDKLKLSNKRARKSTFKKSGTTGWRSLED